jgi:hypothetical protein
MSDALRELLASFVIEVDKAGELAKGNAAIDALKERLTELQEQFKKVKAPAEGAGKAIEDVFARAAQTAKRNIDSIAALSAFGSGRAGATGFGDAFAAAADRAAGAMPQYAPTRETLYDHQRAEFVADAHPGVQYGPTRATMEAGRAGMRAAEEAAAAYAKTLRGRLAGAVQAVRDGFQGGGQSGGPGLIESLATVRNGFLALGAGAAVAGVKRLVDGIGSIGEGAQKLGVTNAQFQRLRVLAAQNDSSVEALGGAFRNLANAAAQPTKATTAAFAKLGVSTKDTNGQLKNSNDLFFDVARGLAGVTNETQRSALAQDLLGRGAQDLKPIFSSGADAVDRQRAALEKLGVISDESIAQADEASDMWAGFGVAILSAAEPLLKVLLPALVDLTKALSTGIGWLGKWLKQTDLVAVAMTALGGYMALKFIPALRLMIGLGGGVSRVFLGMAGSAAKASLAFLRAALPLLAIEDFLVFLRGGDSETGRLIEAIFGKDGVEVTLKAINDLKAGLIDLWNWVTGQSNGAGIKRLWQEFGNGITVMINDLLHSVGIGKGGTNGPFSLMEEISRSTGTGQSYINTPGAYGPPTADGSTRGNAGTAVTIGDTNVTITGYSAADSQRIAADLDTTLERNRDGLASQWP